MPPLTGGNFVVFPLLQGHISDKKTHPSRTPPWAYAQGARGLLGVWAFSDERGTPELRTQPATCRESDHPDVFFFFFISLGLELSDTKVYEP